MFKKKAPDLKPERFTNRTRTLRRVFPWIWPVIVVLLVLGKLLGLVGGFVALASYFVLRPRIGIWRAAAVSAALALAAGVGVVALLYSA